MLTFYLTCGIIEKQEVVLLQFTKEEKAFFARKAKEITTQLRKENIPVAYREQILRTAMIDTKFAHVLGSDLSSDYICRNSDQLNLFIKVSHYIPAIGELLSAKREDILAIRGIGPKKLQRLYDRLIESGCCPRWRP